MSGLILLAVLGLWVAVVTVLTSSFTKSMRPGLFRLFTQPLLFVVIFIAPVADDIIGGFQFRALCKQGYAPVYDEAKAKYRIVTLKRVPVQVLNLKPYMSIPHKNIDSTIIPIHEESWEYVDHVTGETIISWKDYKAKGGWLSRMIGFPQGSPPYTFNGVCRAHDNSYLLKSLQIQEIGVK